MPDLPVTPMALREWSTDSTPAPERLDYWVGAICEAFLEMDCSYRAARVFDGRLKSIEVDNLAFTQVQATTHDVYRTHAAIARSTQQPFYLITQKDTAWYARQGEHRVSLRPGDAVLVDSAQLYELHFPESVALMSIKLPRAWLGQWLTQLDDPAPRLVHRDAGWGRALSGLVLQFAHDPLLAGQYPASLLCDQLGAMLAAALEPAPAAQTQQVGGLLQRALHLLKEQLDQPGLSSETVALALGVSVRTLHRAFAAGACTFAGCLRQLRLERAAQLLAQPRLHSLTVAKIGRRCGFAGHRILGANSSSAGACRQPNGGATGKPDTLVC